MAKQRKETSEKQENRHQLLFDDETTKRAVELAKLESRSFNNLMMWLIKKEYERRQKQAA